MHLHYRRWQSISETPLKRPYVSRMSRTCITLKFKKLIQISIYASSPFKKYQICHTYAIHYTKNMHWKRSIGYLINKFSKMIERVCEIILLFRLIMKLGSWSFFCLIAFGMQKMIKGSYLTYMLSICITDAGDLYLRRR